mmetsp:Transcript_5994/g.20259  ORF Transcript_5994/g.20259 Transcript_5994/m.20259 type:complete len:203 (-) Transcript_5994:294-902(-)
MRQETRTVGPSSGVASARSKRNPPLKPVLMTPSSAGGTHGRAGSVPSPPSPRLFTVTRISRGSASTATASKTTSRGAHGQGRSTRTRIIFDARPRVSSTSDRRICSFTGKLHDGSHSVYKSASFKTHRRLTKMDSSAIVSHRNSHSNRVSEGAGAPLSPCSPPPAASSCSSVTDPAVGRYLMVVLLSRVYWLCHSAPPSEPS